jgi:hypothetical protein
MNKTLGITRTWLFIFLWPVIGFAQETPARKYLVSVERIYDRAPHSAFTDLVEFQGKLYAAYLATLNLKALLQ